MEAERIPKAWLGREVVVNIHEASTEGVRGTLEDVNDRGVVLSIILEGRELPTFYPWSAIRWMRPPADR